MALDGSNLRDGGSAAWQALLSLRDTVIERLPFVAVGVVIAAAFSLAGWLGKRVIKAAAHRAKFDAMLADLLGSVFTALAVVFGILVAFVVIFPTFHPGDMLAGLGITSVALGFAFKDILQNWLAGVFLLWRRPFRLGDQIRSGEHEGTVEGIRVRSTILLTYDGERVIVPNSDVYTRAIVVRTAQDKRRTRLDVPIAYEDDLERARALVYDTLAELPAVLTQPAPWVYVNEFAPSAVGLRIYFWSAPDQAAVLRAADAVASAVKRVFDEAAIDIPYPHQVQIFETPPPGPPPPRADQPRAH